jgi:hypothetical protein
MKRLAKLLEDSKPGDYVAVEFGHNDQKVGMNWHAAWSRRSGR